MNKQFAKAMGLGALLGATFVAGLAFNKGDKDTPVEVMEDGRLQYKWYSTPLPKEHELCGEKVPLERWEIKERLDRELLMNYYMHGSTLLHTQTQQSCFSRLLKRN